MKVRLTGTETECAAAVQALRAGFAVREVSSFYPNRPPSRLGRVYVDVTPLGAEPGGSAVTPTPS